MNTAAELSKRKIGRIRNLASGLCLLSLFMLGMHGIFATAQNGVVLVGSGSGRASALQSVDGRVWQNAAPPYR